MTWLKLFEGMRVMEQRTPEQQGLYDPANEHDACGGLCGSRKGQKSHSIVEQGLLILKISTTAER